MRQEIRDFAAKQLQAPSPSAPCALKVGDRVTYTNPQGVVFHGFMVIGFCVPYYEGGGSVFLDWDCYWFPAKPENMVIEGPAT